MIWLLVGCAIPVIGGMAFWGGYIIGEDMGCENAWNEADLQVEVWKAHALDFQRQLNECNGVVNPPAEASK